ncbi:TIGR00266 family protein [Pseudoxanthobacter sp.]|uniref:TIGR00266 family protein n=1 Tax=Pseudoxanthobacter sp. TaxID=1925742 RepID=UPI002FE42C0E
MQSKIIGTTMPVLELTLAPGERIIAESDQLSWMAGDIALNTTTATAGGGGFLGVFSRVLGGGGLFMTEFSAGQGAAMVAFAAKIPGEIRAVPLTGGAVFLHRHGFLCGTEGLSVGVGFQQTLGAGLFGGNGFILQKVEGQGTAWVALGGEVVIYDLAPGQELLVHPGHVGMFTDGVGFEITTVPGIRNMIFGGDGLFLARLTGPGTVLLQSMPMPNLAHALEPYLPQPGNR